MHNRLLPFVVALLVSLSAGPKVGDGAAAQSAAPALPMPTFHHIHLNSVNPEASLDWYAQFWPRGERTTLGGFPAFHDEIYLLYTKVARAGAWRLRREAAARGSAERVLDLRLDLHRHGGDVRAAVEARSEEVQLPAGLHRARRQRRRPSVRARAVRRSDPDAHPAARTRRPGEGGRADADRRGHQQPGLRLPGRSRRHAGRVQSRSAREFLGPSPLLA